MSVNPYLVLQYVRTSRGDLTYHTISYHPTINLEYMDTISQPTTTLIRSVKKKKGSERDFQRESTKLATTLATLSS